MLQACSSYRGQLQSETTEEYIARLADELDQEFQRIGPQRVAAFVAETVGGSVSSTHPRLVLLLTRKNSRADVPPLRQATSRR